MDIYAALQKDHDEVRSILTKLQSKATDTELFTQLKLEMTIHNRAEEDEFYNSLKPKLDGLSFIAEFSEEEHDIVDEMMAQYEHLNDEQKLVLVNMLKKSIESHVEKEESEIFALAKQHFSALEQDEIAKNFLERKSKIKASMNESEID